ncbi:hypothetical protein [Clostridium sp. D43t1_170807_H7]|uniref:hypothetical protein n=1 Tax=Clostridium sp. D43t1_170807_H7 TaxID=2787140 RepID=UPI0018993426|nr:hypothetical protein [Clostridium sp. D43t1_170807_H7]MEE0931454.1 hypothetical protein [Clostridium sp.]
MRSIRLRKILVGIVVSCVAFGTIGCAEKNTTTENNSNIVSEDLNNQESNDNKEDNVEITDNENNQESIKTIEMMLYSKDVNTDEQVIIGEVEVNEELSLEEKIEKLSEGLSEKAFDNLPIEFVKINNIEGKKVALFNLDELGNNATDITFDKYEGINWINNYFAGSAGGSVTEYTLITTLLQRNYTGEWIDGIEFTYKNSKIEFDHVPALGEVSYR